jgi:predicted transcriptional regulator
MPAGKNTVRTSVLLPEDDYARVQTMAESNHVSAAWVIRAAVVRFLEEHDANQAELPLRLPKVQKATKA